MADLETTLMSLNPMDFVTGMERGFKLGEARAAEERAKALAATQTLMSEEFAGPGQTAFRAAEVQRGTSGAQLGDLLNQINIEATGQARPEILNSLVQQARNINTGAQIRGVELGGQLERAPGQQRTQTAFAAQTEENLPAMLERRQAAFDFDGMKRRAEAGDFAAQRVVVEATRGATQLLNETRADPANQGRDDYEISEIAIRRTTDPTQRAYLLQLQQQQAQQGIQREGNTFPGLSKWLPRLLPGAEVRLTPGTTDQVDIVMTEFQDVYDSQTKQTVRVPSKRMVQSGISLREEDPTNVERFIGRLTGQKVPFVTPNLRQGPATAPTPSQAGAAAAGAPARATAAAVTTTPQQPQVARPAGQPAAAAANPQLDELTQIERSLTAPGFASADERKQAGVLQIIRQLKQERRALNPDTLAQLRRLAGEASVPAVPMQPSIGAEFGGTGISPGGTPVMGLPQATTPAPPTVEEQIRALITVR